MIQKTLRNAVMAGRAGVSLKEYENYDWRMDDLHIIRLMDNYGNKRELFRDIWSSNCFVQWKLDYLFQHARSYANGNKEVKWDHINQSIAKVVLFEPFCSDVIFNDYQRTIEFKLSGIDRLC